MILKKALSFVTALTMIFGMSLMTGCGDNKKGSVKIEYGASMMVNSEGLPFPIEFDSHFLTADEVKAVVNYYYSIEKQDEELAKNSSYPDYLEYLADSFEFPAVKDMLQSNYDTMGNVVDSSNYSFKNIKIVKCVTEEDKDVYTYFDKIDNVINKSLEHNGKDITPKIENRKLIEADIICVSDGEEISLTEKVGSQQIYIYTIDGQPYVL
ncbi:MAG: hypothetical protein K2G63_04715 [Oscillospiraceae bacterium]|nr:hypothetical protein [Oscillospiraceae bacterium]